MIAWAGAALAALRSKAGGIVVAIGLALAGVFWLRRDARQDEQARARGKAAAAEQEARRRADAAAAAAERDGAGRRLRDGRF